MLTSLLLLLPAAQGAPVDPVPVKDLVQVRIHSQNELQRLFRTATDVDDHRPMNDQSEVVIYADDAEQARLRRAGFDLRVEIEDLTNYYAQRAAADPLARNAVGSMGGFRTLSEIYQEMDRLSSTYPGLVSPRFSIGKSIQNRDIYAQRISVTPNVHDPAKPVAWFDAIHHAREPMAGESLLAFEDWLVTHYGVDGAATRIVESRNVIFIPCVNPDGYEYNRQIAPNGGGMWRKNRRNNSGGSTGVDLNRNYSYKWGSAYSGSSGNGSSETYRGTAPFSEPETAAIRDLLAQMPPGMSVSAHTYSNLWIYPWGYDTVYTSENSTFRAFSVPQTAHNGWTYGTAWEVLYTANGVNDDYHYAQYGTYAFTPEIGSSADGFWPSPSRIPALTADALPTYRMVAQWTGAWAEVQDLVWSELSGNGDAFPEPGESWTLSLKVRNSGSQTLLGSVGLSSTDPLISVSGGNASLNIGQLSNATVGGFTVSFDANAQPGVPYTLDASFDYEGYADSLPVNIVLGRPRVLLHDDMESGNFGWTVNNNNNYSWEQVDPQQTTSGGQTVQSGNDNPAGTGVKCWVTGGTAGSSAGTNDVDGTTILTSPLFHAGEFATVELEYARWFANLPGNAQDDVMLVEVSNDDGLTWTTLESTPNANSWQTHSFRLEDFVALSDAMRLRVTVSDSPNNDLTEGMFDDFRLSTVSALPTLGLLGDAREGSTVRLHFDGPPNRSWTLVYAMQRNNGQTVPGVEGLFYLTNYQVLQSGSTGADGTDRWQTTIPSTGSLTGRTVYLQAVYDYGGADAAFSNLLSLQIQ